MNMYEGPMNKANRGRGIIGEKGEGHQGTCIKDTWTKPKGVGSSVGGGDGWGGCVWWAENGDNCT